MTRIDALGWLQKETAHYVDLCHEYSETKQDEIDNETSRSFVNELLKAGAVKVEVEESDDNCAKYIYITVPQSIPKSLFQWLGEYRPDEFCEEEPNVYYMYWDLH